MVGCCWVSSAGVVCSPSPLQNARSFDSPQTHPLSFCALLFDLVCPRPPWRYPTGDDSTAPEDWTGGIVVQCVTKHQTHTRTHTHALEDGKGFYFYLFLLLLYSQGDDVRDVCVLCQEMEVTCSAPFHLRVLFNFNSIHVSPSHLTHFLHPTHHLLHPTHHLLLPNQQTKTNYNTQTQAWSRHFSKPASAAGAAAGGRHVLLPGHRAGT